MSAYFVIAKITRTPFVSVCTVYLRFVKILRFHLFGNLCKVFRSFREAISVENGFKQWYYQEKETER